MSVESITIETDGLDFAALRCGEGDEYAFCFHGFPDDPGSMVPLMERLADAGYTAIAPYMRGYGETDRPPLEPDNYTIPLLGSDVLSVVAAVDADEPLVVGHDWGAIAVTAVAQLDPGFADTCVTMAVPPDFLTAMQRHPTQAMRSWYMSFFQLPGLAEETLRRDDFALVERLWRLWSPNWDYSQERLEAVKATFRTGETVEAAMLYYRAFFEEFLSRSPEAAAVSNIAVPTLLLAGASDGCIGVDLFERSHECYSARQETTVIDGAGHFMHAERPDVVAEEILGFVDGE